MVCFADGVCDGDARRRDEPRGALVAIDLVPPQVVFDPLPLVRDDVVFAVHEVGDGDAVDVDVDRAFAESALPESGERQSRLAQRLRRNRAGVDARAAEDRLALDESDTLPKVRRLRSALLAGRSGADDDEVVHGFGVWGVGGGVWEMGDFDFSTAPHSDHSLVRNQRMNGNAIESRAPIEERQLDYESGGDDGGAAFARERGRAGGGAAGGEQVVDEQDAVVGGEGIVVNLEDAAAVFEGVLAAPRFPRQFAGLADRHEAAAEDARDAAAEDEAARFDRRYVRDAGVFERLGQRVRDVVERFVRAQQRRDVFEDDAGLGKSGTSRMNGRRSIRTSRRSHRVVRCSPSSPDRCW